MAYSLKTPVGFFIFNRPDTTLRVFEKIREAKPPILLIVADGPRKDHPSDAELCAETRSFVDRIDWPCDVRLRFAAENLGCGPNVSAGYDWIFSQVEEAIFLEDDTLPDITFFRYCEELLEKYRYDTRIGIISGVNFEFSMQEKGSSYSYIRIPELWGWASWRRVWQTYDYNMSCWPDFKREEGFLKVFNDSLYSDIMTRIFDDLYYQDKKHTWDYQLYLSLLVNGMLGIVPKINLVSNIGMTGIHYNASKVYPEDLHSLINRPIGSMDFPLKQPKFIISSREIEEKARNLGMGLWDKNDRMKFRIKQCVKRMINYK